MRPQASGQSARVEAAVRIGTVADAAADGVAIVVEAAGPMAVVDAVAAGTEDTKNRVADHWAIQSSKSKGRGGTAAL